MKGLEAGIREHMPACAYREFCLWALTTTAPQQTQWLQVMGISQLIRMTLELLDGLADDSAWRQLAELTVPMNVYRIFEIVSDNLAVGLASDNPLDPTSSLRSGLLCSFNEAMVNRLNGQTTPARETLAPMKSATMRISGFTQSLAAPKHAAIAQYYLDHHPEILTLDDIIWPSLVVNIETCATLAESVAGDYSGTGLIKRYRGVNRLLADRPMSLLELVHTGADTILVVPTLAYYCAVLGEAIHPSDEFKAAIQDHAVAQTLYDAALLVRLLNDLGTGLVFQTAAERTQLLSALRSNLDRIASSQSPTIADLLLTGPEQLLTRIRKDINHGEFNVCLTGLMETPVDLDVLEERLTYFSELYVVCRDRFCQPSDGAGRAPWQSDGESAHRSIREIS